MAHSTGISYFLTVEGNEVIGHNTVIGPVGNRQRPNWRATDADTYKQAVEALEGGVNTITISRHGFLELKLNLESYREYAIGLIKEAKRKAQQQETINVEGNLISVQSTNLLALCCSAISGVPLAVEDSDDNCMVDLSSESSRKVLGQFVTTMSRLNNKYFKALDQIKKAEKVDKMRSALNSVGLKGK